MKRRLLIAGLLMASGALGQTAAPAPSSEDAELQQAFTNAANSPQGYIRELEAFLVRHPDNPRKLQIQGLLFQSAIEAKDIGRVARYGEILLAQDPNDIKVLENTIVAELKLRGAENGTKVLAHAQQLEKLVIERTSTPKAGPEQARQILDRQRGLARAYLYEARAEGLLNEPEKAADFAKKSYDSFPSAESAREAGWWLDQAHHPADAVAYLADAFMVPDSDESAADRSGDRQRLAQLYKDWKGSEAGLGDVLLEAYDRVTAIKAERRLAMAKLDPNVQASSPMQFTLSSLDGSPLHLADLAGKVVVMDFWATWCGPCRAQHPIIEDVKKKFAGRQDVVFLAINAGESRAEVEPFVKAQGWHGNIYFEDGLAAALHIESLPTTIIIDRQGKVSERMKGFIPTMFGEQLSERIEAALGDAHHGG